MDNSYAEHDPLTWDTLMQSINNLIKHIEETQWLIYIYIKDHFMNESPEIMHLLMFTYLKIRTQEPSLLNSLMLGQAVRMSHRHEEFPLDTFVREWGYPAMLRKEDICDTFNGSCTMPSLKVRTEEAIFLHSMRRSSTCPDGSKATTMIAVKIHSKPNQTLLWAGVTLMDSYGNSVMAPATLFPVAIGDIQHGIFEVKTSHNAQSRVTDITKSEKQLEDLVPPIVGYVESFDTRHGHYHIYDSLSRHFVADHPHISLNKSDYVMFCPMIPVSRKFKSAIPTRVIEPEEGRRAFGCLDAYVSYIDKDRGFLHYIITSEIASTPEGVISNEGFAPLSCLSDSNRVPEVNDTIRIVVILKRKANGKKGNHVVEIIY